MLLERRIERGLLVLTLTLATACQTVQSTSTTPVSVQDSPSASVADTGRAGAVDSARASRDTIALEQSEKTGMSWGRRVLWFYGIVGLIGMTIMAYALWR